MEFLRGKIRTSIVAGVFSTSSSSSSLATSTMSRGLACTISELLRKSPITVTRGESPRAVCCVVC